MADTGSGHRGYSLPNEVSLGWEVLMIAVMIMFDSTPGGNFYVLFGGGNRVPAPWTCLNV